MSIVSALVSPSRQPPQTTRLPRAVIQASIETFHYHDGQWVFGMDEATVLTDSFKRIVGRTMFTVRAEDAPQLDPETRCYEGPEGSSAMILQTDGAPAVEVALHGMMRSMTCKKRKYRLKCVNVVWCAPDAWYVVDCLYGDFSFDAKSKDETASPTMPSTANTTQGVHQRGEVGTVSV